MLVRSAVPALLLAAALVSPAVAQQTQPFEPRPDLALTLQDLPPGFGILPDRPGAPGPIAAASRGYARPDSAEGWSVIASLTLAADDPRLASMFVPSLAQLFTDSLPRAGLGESGSWEPVGWQAVDALGLGDQAIMYHFRIDGVDLDPRADGGLTVFRRHQLIGAVLVVSEHGEGLTAVRDYASVIDDRMKRALAQPDECWPVSSRHAPISSRTARPAPGRSVQSAT